MVRLLIRYKLLSLVPCMCLSVGASLLLAQEKQGISPKEIQGIRTVNDLQLSPDGHRVAYVLRDLQEAKTLKEGAQNRVWVVKTDGTEVPQELAKNLKNAGFPRWAPDGHALAFLSDGVESSGNNEEPGNQIYLLRGESTKPERLTSTKGGVGWFEWSPDSKLIAFITRSQKSEADLKKESEGDDALEVDRNLPFSQLWVLSLADGSVVQVPQQGFEIKTFAWSPDESEFAAFIVPTPILNDAFHPSLVVIDRATGKVVRTLSKKAGLLPTLQWSPNGQFILFNELSQPPPNSICSWYFATVPSAGGPVRPILADRPFDVLDAQWLPDSTHVVAQILANTQGYLANVDTQDSTFVKMTDVFTSRGDFSFSTNGRLTAYLNQTTTSPNDVWILASGKSATKLTNLNPQISRWNLSPVTVVRWKDTQDGLDLDGLLVTPPGFQKGHRCPTIVQAHTGDSAWSRGWLASWSDWAQLLASHGYVVFLPNTRGVIGRGVKFHDMGSNGGGLAVQDLLDGVDYLVSEGIADPTRLGIGGWSNGGNATMYAITRTPRFKAAIVIAGVSDFFSFVGTSSIGNPTIDLRFKGVGPYTDRGPYDKESPISNVAKCKTPTLLLYGAEDAFVPAGQGFQFYYALKRLGVEAEMVTYPREGHGFYEPYHGIDVQTRVLNWFDTHLLK
jgi:dipeptidyl aminopeptidase/acylaminoacyl peptidase